MALEFNIFKNHPEVVYGTSEQSDGSMGYTTPGESKQYHLTNRQRFFRTHNLPKDRLYLPLMKHGTDITVLEQYKKTDPPVADGVVTPLSDVVLGITNADCFPIFAYDPIQHICGIAHAGWRGVVGNIAGNLILTMTAKFRCLKGDIHIGIGPGIRKCHFEINAHALPHFIAYSEFVYGQEKKIFVALDEILRRQLLYAGVTNAHIELSQQCTYCLSEKYFSNRRGQPKKLETMISYIYRRSEK